MVVVAYSRQLPEVLCQPFTPRTVFEAGTPIIFSVRVADITSFDSRAVYDVDKLSVSIDPGTSILLF